jgi:hypothetical protein
VRAKVAGHDMLKTEPKLAPQTIDDVRKDVAGR